MQRPFFGGGGFAGGTIPGNVIISGTLEVTGAVTFTTTVTGSGDIYAGAAFDIGFTGRGKFKSPADGILTALNAAEDGFTRLQLGGTTSAFPSIKRNSTAINLRLADDSADADVTAGAATVTSVTSTGNLMAGAATELGWTGRATMKSSADGIIELFNDAVNGFTRLNFGGTSSSEPAIKKNSAALNFRLADDSADANITAGVVTASGQVLSANGTAGAPGYSSTNDPNSGIFWNADDTMRFSLGGTERFRGTTTGMDFGTLALFFGSAIGTSTVGLECPASGILEVTDGSTGQGRLRVGLGSAASPALQIGTAGNDGFTQSASAFIDVSTAGSVRWRFANAAREFRVGSDILVSWASGTDPQSATADTMVGRFAPGVIQVGTTAVSTTLIGAIKCSNLVEAITADNTITAGESRTLFTNEGAAAERTHTLPTAAAGYHFEFYVHTAQSLKIAAATGDTIRVAAGVSATAGYVRCATAGAVVTLKAVNATEWVAMYQTGTWTVDA